MKLKVFSLTLISAFAFTTSVHAQTVDSLNLGGFDPTQKQSPNSDATPEISKSAGLSHANALLHASGNPIGGNPNGSISMVEFFDYQCHHCVDMDPKVNKLASSNANLRIVYKEFPIRGPVSEYAAKAALAANLQGKYFEFHEALMKNSESLSENKINQLASSIGLDVSKMKSQMSSDAITSQINENYHLAQSMGISGTPAFFISKTDNPTDATTQVVMGQVDEDFMQKILNKINH